MAFGNPLKTCLKYLLIGVVSLTLFGCTQKKIFINTLDSQSNRYGTQEKAYTNGVMLVTSTKTHSSVRFEVAQEQLNKTQNEPLTQENDEEFIFDTPSVSAFYNSNPVKILNFEEVKQSGLNFGLAIESFGVVVSKEPSQSKAYPYTTYPSLIYRGYPGFVFYDPWFGARDRIEQEQRLEEKRRIKSIILSSYLRKNTLKANGEAKGGFIVIPPKSLKSGVLRIEVRILDEIHTLSLSTSKRKRTL